MSTAGASSSVNASPVKPWESNNSSTTTTAAASSGEFPVGAPMSASIASTGPYSRYSSPQMYRSPLSSRYASSYGGYGGYGGSSYGGYGGGYGASSYGGYGGYGSSYGGGYGGGGYGMQQPQQPLQIGSSLMQNVEKGVYSFGRFSELLHMNLDALHMSFSSFLQLLTNVTALRHEFGSVLTDALGIKTLFVIVQKLKMFLQRAFHYILLGEQGADLEYVFRRSKSKVNGRKSKLWTLFFVIAAVFWIVKRLLMRLSHAQQIPGAEQQFSQSIPSQSQFPPYPQPINNNAAYDNNMEFMQNNNAYPPNMQQFYPSPSQYSEFNSYY